MDNFSVGSIPRDPYQNQGSTDSGNRKRGRHQNSPDSTDADVVELSEPTEGTAGIEDAYTALGLIQKPR